MVPSVFNELILNNHIQIDSNSSEKIMQESDSVCKVLVYLCNWMFNQKYTNYSVKYRLWSCLEYFNDVKMKLSWSRIDTILIISMKRHPDHLYLRTYWQ